MKKLLFFLIFFVNALSFLSAAQIEEESYPVVILGGGIGAMTSATYLARAGIQPLVITGPVVGGTITLSNEVQNWPGELNISGDALSEKLYKQAEFNGALLRSEVVTSVDFSKRPFIITVKPVLSDGTEGIKRYKTNTCIIALGATPNLLNVPGETQYWTHGVYSCAVCDGALYKNKIVAVVGGGDSALIEAQYLSNLAKKVYLIVRKEKIRAIEKKRAQEILARPNIEVLYETIVQEIKGEEGKMTHLILSNNHKKEITTIPVNALFLAIGSRPNTELFYNQLELDDKKYIILKKNQEASIEGVYAIGDVADPEFKQAISAAGDGAKAALQAQKFLTSYFPQTQARETASPLVLKAGVTEIFSRQQFDEELLNAKGPVFVDFYSNQCGPCKMFKPIYNSWAKDFHGKITFLKVSVDAVDELFEIYKINVVPTVVIFDREGKVILKNAGTREIAQVEKCLQKIKDKPEIFPQDFK